MSPLLKARVLSFLYSAGTLFLLAIIGVFVSDDFKQLVANYTGSGFFGSIVSLLLVEVVKHLRNLSVLKNVGGKSEKEFILI